MKFKIMFLSLGLMAVVLTNLKFSYDTEYDCSDCLAQANYVDNYISDWNNPKEEDYWGSYPTDYERDTEFDTIDFFHSKVSCY